MENSKLKFRAWDKNRKKMWSHSDLYKMDCSNEYPFLALIRGFYATNMFPGEEMDVIPMQFTGLYDKNGKEIYEGDILECHYKTKGNVFFHDGSFRLSSDKCELNLEDIHSYDDLNQYLIDDNNLIVIGNIYENPELLEESK